MTVDVYMFHSYIIFYFIPIFLKLFLMFFSFFFLTFITVIHPVKSTEHFEGYWTINKIIIIIKCMCIKNFWFRVRDWLHQAHQVIKKWFFKLHAFYSVN